MDLSHLYGLESWTLASERLSLDAFEARYGPAFAVVWLHGVEQLPRLDFDLDSRENATCEFLAAAQDTDELTSTGINKLADEAIMAAFPLRRRPESAVSFISVGRTPNNDVQLLDSSISRFHAYLRQNGRQWTVQDAGSANGTEVNFQVVPEHGAGPASRLQSRDSIGFGGVRGVFLSAADFCADLALNGTTVEHESQGTHLSY